MARWRVAGTPQNPRGKGQGRRPPWLPLAAVLAVCAICTALAVGCAATVRPPLEPLDIEGANANGRRAYDTDADGQADYVTEAGPDGRINRIGYDTTGDGRADTFQHLDALSLAVCRHVVLIVDGIGYQAVKGYRDAGHLRLFHEPAPVISTFPSTTDLALADAFRSVRPLGYEARYFNHRTGRMAGGDGDYLSLVNEDWDHYVDYRADTLVDPLSYLFPQHYLKEEIQKVNDLIARRDRPQVVAYLVSTAGMGTMHLLEGQHEVLAAVDRLTRELVWRTRGLVKVTVFSDHGHQLVRAQWINYRTFLRDRGWRITDTPTTDDDVAVVDYGLVTYAAFATRRRAALAEALLEHEGTDVVLYTAEGDVVVCSDEGRARVQRRGNRFRYVPDTGDPLHLAALMKHGREAGALDADGFADARTWLRLTADHAYPDAVVRAWRAFHELVEHVPDVVASLKHGYNAGLPSRASRFPEGASSHGDLAAKSSTAFVISTAGAVPESARPLRSRDLPDVLHRLTGRPWPPPHKETP